MKRLLWLALVLGVVLMAGGFFYYGDGLSFRDMGKTAAGFAAIVIGGIIMIEALYRLGFWYLMRFPKAAMFWLASLPVLYLVATEDVKIHANEEAVLLGAFIALPFVGVAFFIAGLRDINYATDPRNEKYPNPMTAPGFQTEIVERD